MRDENQPKANNTKISKILILILMLLLIPLTIRESLKSQQIKQQAQTAGLTVAIQGMQYNPPTLTVKVGDTVTWVNQSSEPHTTTSDMQGSLDTWDSQGMATGAYFNRTFITPGTFPYHCGFHPNMKGTIIVVKADTTISPSPVPTKFVPSPACLGTCPTLTVAYPTISSTTSLNITNTPTPSIFFPTTSPVLNTPTVDPALLTPILTDVPISSSSSEVVQTAGSQTISSIIALLLLFFTVLFIFYFLRIF